MDSLKKLEPSVDEALNVLLTQLSKFGPEPINMGLWAQLFAFGKLVRPASGPIPFGSLHAQMSSAK